MDETTIQRSLISFKENVSDELHETLCEALNVAAKWPDEKNGPIDSVTVALCIGGLSLSEIKLEPETAYIATCTCAFGKKKLALFLDPTSNAWKCEGLRMMEPAISPRK